MKATKRPNDEMIWIIVVGFILATIIFGIYNDCKSQSIHLDQVCLTPSKLVLNITYKGQPELMGAVSLKISSDPAIFQYDSAVPLGKYHDFGQFLCTYPPFAIGWYAISWFQASPSDSVWLDDKPMFAIYYTRTGDGCCLFDFQTIFAEDCELDNINAQLIPCNFADTVICTPISTYIPEMEKNATQGRRCTLLGQVSVRNNFEFKNRKIYKP